MEPQLFFTAVFCLNFIILNIPHLGCMCYLSSHYYWSPETDKMWEKIFRSQNIN